MGLLLKVFLSGYLIAGLISCDDSGGDSSSQKSPPEFKITHAPPVTLANRDAYEIAGTCTTKGESIIITVGVLPSVKSTCDEDYQWQETVATVDVSSVNTGNPLSITVTELDMSIVLEVERDTIPPQIAIDGDQAIINSINQGNYQIAGSCDEVDGEVVLDVGGVADKAICNGSDWLTDPIDLSGLDATVVQVSADLKDKWGNPARQATGSLARDIIPPDSVTIAPPAIISESSINSYSLSGECAEDGTDAIAVKIARLNDLTADCTSQLWNLHAPSSELAKLPEQQGIVLTVEHRDSAGNVVSISGSVDKDTTAPELAITSGLVINIDNQNSYQLEGDCSENDRDVSIILGSNAADTESCSNRRWTYSPNVGEGSFSVTITQSDAVGNTGTLISPTPLVKDITAPTFDFASDLNINAANQRQYYVGGTCSEVGDIEVGVSKGSFEHQETARCDGSSWTTSAIDVSTIPSTSPVSVELSATMTDAAGNPAAQGKSKTVRKDTTSRSVAIDRLPGNPDKAPPINRSNAASYPVAGGCSHHTGDVTVTVGEGSNTVTATGSCTGGRWTVTVEVPSTVTDDPAVAVSASFGSGTDKVSDATTALKDIVAPTLGLTPPPPITSLNQDSYHLEGSCTGGQGAVSLDIGGISASANCASDAWQVNDLDVSSLTGSSITITVDVFDAAGNPAVQLSKTVARDVEAPTLTITSAEDITTANEGSYTIAGNCGETGTGNVKITIGSGTPQTIDCTATGWTLSPTIDDIPERLNLALVVEHRDSYGNVRVVNDQTIGKDTIAPQVMITTPLAEITESNLASYPLSGTCTFGDRPLTVAVGTAAPDRTVDCETGGTWSASVDISSLERGTFDVTVSQTDTLGNTGDDSESITKIIGSIVVSAGGAHTCALKPNGQVACWGAGSYGQLGNGGTEGSLTPVDVHTSSTDSAALSGIVAISSGGNHTCALTEGGKVKCWGTGFSGQLGHGGATSGSTPVDVLTSSTDSAALSGIDAISSGANHTCALTTGDKVKCWGAGNYGQLGNGGTTGSSTPVDVRTSSTDFAAISSGESHTCALSTAETGGNVVCWGRGSFGQLGHGGTAHSSTPVDVHTSSSDSAALSGIVAISSGRYHTCALTEGDNVNCWGYGYYGQLGNGGATSGSTPVDTPVDVLTSSTDSDALGGIAAISSGESHTCALTEGGNVNCWGRGSYGQLGHGGTDDNSTPVDVRTSSTDPSALDGIAAISSGESHTCATTTGGNIVCWGAGSDGRLGNGRADSHLAPVDVHTNSTDSSALDGIAAISSGESHTCAFTTAETGGNVVCWGRGNSGQLGNGGTTGSSTPVDVHTSSSDSAALSGIVAISSGRYHTCAFTTGGKVVCWGDGNEGQLGNGGTDDNSTPVDVQTSSSDSAALGDIAAISSGDLHTCALTTLPLTTGNNVVCWGRGNSGQLGNGGTARSSTPVKVRTSSSDSSALGGIAAISSGSSHTCALTTGNNVVCWGRGNSGQLGNGGTARSLIPVDVHTSSSDTSALSGIAAISSGSNHTCAVTEGGNVKCWGNGFYGGLGNGATTNSLTPVDVHTSSSDSAALGSIAAISSGHSYTCALTTGNNIKCWGAGSYGRLGNGGTGSSSIPVDVRTSSSDSAALGGIAAISSGPYHTCALTTGNNVVCWGREDHGQLGNNGVGVPVSVIGLGPQLDTN